MQDYLKGLFRYKDGELYWRVSRSNRIKEGQIAGDIDGRGYRRIYFDGRHHKMHRIIWIMHNGDIPLDILVDHIDQNRQNNLIENLRLVTKSQNNLNRSDVKGVSWDKVRKKWKAQISIENKTRCIGRYDTYEEAKQAYLDVKQIIMKECVTD